MDGHHIGRGWTGLPVDRPLWGVVDVYGKCAKIKAEVLSDGKGVIYTYMYMREGLGIFLENCECTCSTN